MSISEVFQQQLNAEGTFHDSPRDVEARDGERRIVCRLFDLDRLACRIELLRLETSELDGASTDRLRTISDTLSARLNYLLEPISPVELDQQGCTVQLRSNPPQKDEDQTCYYELLVRRGGSIGLARYRAASGAPREMLPAELTREVLVRLIDDFEAVLA